MNENENGLHTPENENSEPKTEACPPHAPVAPQRTSYPESPPHVPPSETTLEHPDARGQQAFAAFGTVPTQTVPTPNEYCNGVEPRFTPEDALNPIPLPRPAAEKGHNAFRDEPSAMSEAVRKKHFLLRGVNPLEGEPPHAYHGRMAHEARLLHDENVAGLKSSFTKISLLLLLYLLVQFIILYSSSFIVNGFGLLEEGNDLQSTLLNVVLYVLIYPVLFPIVIYLGNLGETHKTRTFLRKPKCSPSYIFKWFVIATGCTYVINIAFSIITSIIGYDNGMTAEPFTSVFDAVSQLVILCVFAPIFEETLFRGTMLSHHLKYGAWHACIITSLYFGFFHANLQQLFYTFVGGIFLSMAVLKTGSIVTSIIMHALLNFTSFLQMVSLSLIDNYDAYINGVDMLPTGHPAALVLFAFTTLMPWVFMIAAVIMLIVELVTNKATFRMPKGDSGLTAKEKLTAYFTTPAVWATVVFVIFAITLNEVIMYLNTHPPQ